MSMMLKLTKSTTKNLATLVEMTGHSPEHILELAIEAFMRDQFFRKTNEEFERLKADPKAWAEMRQELKDWEVTLGDGLKDDPWSDLPK